MEESKIGVVVYGDVQQPFLNVERGKKFFNHEYYTIGDRCRNKIHTSKCKIPHTCFQIRCKKQTFQSWLLQTLHGQQFASHQQPALQQPVRKEESANRMNHHSRIIQQTIGSERYQFHRSFSTSIGNL